jgi:predicted O-methyltransferase YrrM
LEYAVLTLPYSASLTAYNRTFATSRRHPFYAWLGMRPVLAQHTSDEHAALEKWASGRSTVVEIGVAEGVSAFALRHGMAPQGTLYLIDPFHFSKHRMMNFTKRTAHRLVGQFPRGRVAWIEKFSFDAVPEWGLPIDLLFIDGDHSEEGVGRDWTEWSRFVVPGGIVIFHDARIFEGGWTSPEYGPVKLVDRLFRAQRIPGWTIAEEIHSLVIVEKFG